MMAFHETEDTSEQKAAETCTTPSQEDALMDIWGAWRSGVIGFGLASLAVFGSWAFMGSWFYQTFSELGSYLAWLAMYLLIGSYCMKHLIAHQDSTWAFFKVFGTAFAAYAILWIAGYMGLRGFVGELLGGILGTLGMGGVICIALKGWSEWKRIWLVLAISNLTGYFLGSWMHQHIGGSWGAICWGIPYGIMFGGGIGVAFWIAQGGRIPVRP